MEMTARGEGLRRWQRRLRAALATLGAPRIRLWLITTVLTVGIFLHYGDMLPLLSAAADQSPIGLAYRQDLERILFLLPVIYATYVFGAQGGIATLAVAGAIMLPRALMSTAIDHTIPEVGGVMVVGGLLVLAIAQQQREVDAQKRARHDLNYFVRQILTAQEGERKRIALELHDETAQALLVTCQRLDRLASSRRCRLPVEVGGELQELRAVMVQALADLRRLTQNLRPRILDDHGLVPALEWLADDLSDQYGIKARMQVGAAWPEQSRETELILFRIAQEALRNVGRHSGATEAVVSLDGDEGRVRMTVADNGRGFELAGSLSDLANKGQLGLLGMFERARLLGGTLDIRSELGKGTTMVVELPASAASPLPAAGSSAVGRQHVSESA